MFSKSNFFSNCVCCISLFLCSVGAFPDQGQWTRSYAAVPYVLFGMHKSLYAGSTVSLSVNCEPSNPTRVVEIKIGWILRQTSCFEEYLGTDIFREETLKLHYLCPMNTNGFSKVRYLSSEPEKLECSSRIHLEFTNSSLVPSIESTKISMAQSCERNLMTGLSAEKLPMAVQISSESSKSLSLVGLNSLKVNTSEKIRNGVLEQLSAKDDTSPLEEQMRTLQQKMHINHKRSASNYSLIAKNTSYRSIIKQGNINVAKSHDTEKKLNEKFDELTRLHKDPSSTLNQHDNFAIPLASVHHNTIKPGSKLAVVDMDGVYLFVLRIESTKNELINITVDVTMKGDHGYLSAVDFPLLLFYGFMCGVYVLYAFSWLFVSALQWRDLLRIQFWIGGVILLGLIEKAVFYAEYQSINSTGQSVQGAVLFAEILSCMKRTLARMLVIIVSLGFGIVKPRLGPMLHRVVGVGGLYFILGTIEGCLRVLKPKNDPSNQALMAGIPLAVTDSAICWWIFSSLVQTIRTLRLRRNIVKLSLYRHFTNTLIFAVFASVAYMVWSIHSHKLVSCITDWKELWVDEAYWHLLFSLVLLVIMILWRPTNNNQRYAFTPLLDAVDDEDDDDIDQSLTNDAFAGMKMRASKILPNMSPKQNDSKNKQDDDLKWVEENIPSSLTETALPSLLDSDEEIMTAKFERSKME